MGLEPAFKNTNILFGRQYNQKAIPQTGWKGASP